MTSIREEMTKRDKYLQITGEVVGNVQIQLVISKNSNREAKRRHTPQNAKNRQNNPTKPPEFLPVKLIINLDFNNDHRKRGMQKKVARSHEGRQWDSGIVVGMK